MTYNTVKRILNGGNKNKFVTIEKLDIFLLANRISESEYQELSALLLEVEAR